MEAIETMVKHMQESVRHYADPENEKYQDKDGNLKFSAALLAVMEDPKKGRLGLGVGRCSTFSNRRNQVLAADPQKIRQLCVCIFNIVQMYVTLLPNVQLRSNVFAPIFNPGLL